MSLYLSVLMQPFSQKNIYAICLYFMQHIFLNYRSLVLYLRSKPKLIVKFKRQQQRIPFKYSFYWNFIDHLTFLQTSSLKSFCLNINYSLLLGSFLMTLDYLLKNFYPPSAM